MKKILISLLVLALCAPAMAVVDFTAVNNGNGTFTIKINTNGDIVRGVAIKVACTGTGCDLDLAGTQAIANYVNPAFNCYIDYAHDAGAGYTAVGQGHPFAQDGAAGVALDAATTFVVSMGVLDQGGNQAGFSNTAAANLITIKVGAGSVTLSADTLRGPDAGAVGDVTLTSTGLPVTLAVTSGPGCQDYNLTKLAGGTDNLVNASDLNALVTYVNTNKTGSIWVVNASNPNYNPIYNITAKQGGTDTLINASDLNALVTYVNVTKTGALWVVNCTTVP